MATITDEYILNRKTVSTKDAAAYLCISWWMLTDMLQQGKAPFGYARQCPSGKWAYTILPERLWRYKHGIDDDPAAAIIAQKLDELTRLLEQWKEGAA